jgi:hypothetical protein
MSNCDSTMTRLTVWRIAAGDKEKDLVPLMIRDQVMLVGPGSTGDLANMSEAQVRGLPPSIQGFDPGALVAFRFRAQVEQIVVLRLGSVCFSVGVIKSKYFHDNRYAQVYSYWNPVGRFRPTEPPWDLQHARKVDWYGLTDMEALGFFRRGIYGGQQRFCQVLDQELHNYLNRLGYNNTNGDAVLSKVGQRCARVNAFGFPTP